MDIKIVDQNEEVSEAPKEVADPQGMEVTGDLLRQQVASVFDFKPSEIGQYKGKLDTLIDYAKSMTDDHTVAGLKWAIRDLGLKLGTPPLGEKLINYLHIYARLHLDEIRIKKEKERFIKHDDN